MGYSHDSRRVFWYGIAALFILVGIAAVLGVIFNVHSNQYSLAGSLGIVWSLVGVIIGLIFLFVFILVILLIARSIAWASRSSNSYGHPGRLQKKGG
ncbi:MAG: hypothetical protein QXU18_07825, partial [Thermoplasmatales archaeon]